MKGKIKVGVIGVGFFGRKHARIYNQLPEAELVAVSDINEKRAKKIGNRLNCQYYTDYQQLLALDLDAVDIVVPDDLHREVTLQALETEKDIMLEKPLAVTKKDCEALFNAAREANNKFMIGHILRFDPRSRQAKNKITKGEIGEIVHVTSRRNSPISGARHYAGHCELATHSGVHDFDLVRWLVDSEYKSVYAKGRQVKLTRENIDMYDSILSLFTFENGVIYQAENSWILPENYPTELEAKLQIVGTEGVLKIEILNQGLEICNEEKHFYPDVQHWPEIEGEIEGYIHKEVQSFIHCVKYDKPVPVTVEDGYHSALSAINVLNSIDKDSEISFA